MSRLQNNRAAGMAVETITNERTGKSAIMRLRKPSMWFTCTIGEDFKESKDANEVREWARKLLAVSDAVEWRPVLEVNADTDWSGRSYRYDRRDDEAEAGVKIAVARYWIGRTPGGKWFHRKLSPATNPIAMKSAVAVAL